MNITNLNEFLAIVKYGTFENAAEHLFTTQSTLSKHIQKMESELGVVLFERNSRKVILSDCGRIMLPYAQEITALEKQYQNALQDYKQNTSTSLNLGAVSHFAAYRISEVLVDFQNTYPHIHLNIFGESPIRIREKLMSHVYDLAFLRCSERTNTKDLICLPFTDDMLVAACSKKHPLAGRSSVSLKELKHERMLGYPNHTFMHGFMLDACSDAGFFPMISLVANHTENLLEFSSQGMGICLLMKKPILNTYHPNIAILDIDPPYKCKINLCYLRDRKLSSTDQKFIEFVHQWKSSDPYDDV